ncbi:site-specific integrase [Labrenzia sp. PHM005]|uniref:tyrosine-type recombinase/integrase n=1 Tax=Labrenzia sp. PHM005 TaxID=2590016 RepID=UPI0011402B94|nr:site-specific integrase [Labrenzia sp. PHM005]QDG78330.1 DUF4102 domain-containing protein [Labrenzia sp. PHM005]
MARTTNKLSARQVQSLREPGRFGDGGGLYLVISKSGSKTWSLIFQFGGKRKEMGLGPFPVVSLADARLAAASARTLIKDGVNPIEHRKANGSSKQLTFGAFADSLLDDILVEFRNPKHKSQWRMTIREYAAPIRDKPVADIDTADVLEVLKPHWLERPETASRLRGRLERVFAAAIAKGLREKANPAIWKGHLDALLPRPKKLTRGHHKALDYERLPEFMKDLRKHEGISALALELLILSVTRTSEVLNAKWAEIDLHKKIWTIPSSRMKAGKEHRIPLSPRSLAILEKLKPFRRPCDFLFPGQREGRPLSYMSLTMQLRRMKFGDATIHGFRSSFRDWCGEETHYPREIAEQALAHSVGSAVERAYRRGDALEKRRELMLAWQTYCDGNDAVELEGASAG